MKLSDWRSLLAIPALVLATGANAEPVELNYAIGLPAASVQAIAAERFAKEFAESTNGEFQVTVYPLSLLNLAETLSGIRDGIADAGYGVPAYSPAELPHNSFIGEVNVVLDEQVDPFLLSHAYGGAIAEYIMTQCPDCIAEYDRQNHVYLGAIAVNYSMLCKKPMATPADFQGMRYHATSATLQRFAESLGATRVRMSTNEVYEAFGHNLIDCTILSAQDLKSLSLAEVISHATVETPGIIYGGSAIFNFNKERWQGLDQAQRETLLRGVSDLSAGMQWDMIQGNVKGVEFAVEKGVTLVEASPELVSATAEFLGGDVKTVVETYETNYGLSDLQEKVDLYTDMVKKWVSLVENVQSMEDLKQVYWDNLYSKIDASAYGMD